MMDEMKLSVIMPAYNCEQYVKQSVESILHQSLQELEVIVIDDCSTDATYEIVKELAKTDKRIIILRNEQQIGVANTRNRGMDLAAGKYIYFFDADDILESEVLYKAYVLLEDEQLDFAYLCYKEIDDTGTITRHSAYRNMLDDELNIYEKESEQIDWGKWYIATWSKVYRKEFISNLNVQFQDLPVLNDRYFDLVAILSAKRVKWVIGEDCELCYRRQMRDGKITANKDPFYGIPAYLKIQDKLVQLGIWQVAAPYFYEAMAMGLASLYERDKQKIRKEAFTTFLVEVGIKMFLNRTPLIQHQKELRIIRHLNQLVEGERTIELYMQDKFFDNYCVTQQDEDNYLKSIKENGQIVSVWGCGTYGTIIMCALQYLEIPIQYVFDRGLEVYECNEVMYQVSEFQEVADEVEILLITSSKYYKEIEQEVRKINKKCTIIHAGVF